MKRIGSQGRVRTVAAVLVFALALAGCGDDDESSSGTDTAASGEEQASTSGDTGQSEQGSPDAVEIVDFDYEPKEVTVKAGTALSFSNSDQAKHTATSEESGLFDTGTLERDDEGTITAPGQPGTYAYVCRFHPFMNGTVEVE